jgi:hypothetical protein
VIDPQWRPQIVRFCRWMRGRGWQQPFVFRGRGFTCVGMATPRQLQRRHANDNR